MYDNNFIEKLPILKERIKTIYQYVNDKDRNKDNKILVFEFTSDSIIYTIKNENKVFFLEDYIDEEDYVIMSSYINNIKQPTLTGKLKDILLTII